MEEPLHPVLVVRPCSHLEGPLLKAGMLFADVATWTRNEDAYVGPTTWQLTARSPEHAPLSISLDGITDRPTLTTLLEEQANKHGRTMQGTGTPIASRPKTVA